MTWWYIFFFFFFAPALFACQSVCKSNLCYLATENLFNLWNQTHKTIFSWHHHCPSLAIELLTKSYLYLLDTWLALPVLSSFFILVLPHSCLCHSDSSCCSLYRDNPSKCCVTMMQQKLRITATLCKGNTHCYLVTLTLCLLSLNVNSVRLSSLFPFLLSVCLIPHPCVWCPCLVTHPSPIYA